MKLTKGKALCHNSWLLNDGSNAQGKTYTVWKIEGNETALDYFFTDFDNDYCPSALTGMFQDFVPEERTENKSELTKTGKLFDSLSSQEFYEINLKFK